MTAPDRFAEPRNNTCPICWKPLGGVAENLFNDNVAIHRACDTRPLCKYCDEPIGSPYSHDACGKPVPPVRKFA